MYVMHNIYTLTVCVYKYGIHLIDHESLHSCHSQPECPPCTVLTAKICYGGHEVYTILNSLCLERKTQRNIVKQARYI